MKKRIETDIIKIKTIMMKKGIKQNELAKQLGVSNTAINLEINGKNASRSVRKGIADILGVEVGTIFREVNA